ncbi:MAG TPA: folylpolyglutamate synthase/dihydrofolate synthase family protein [Verrucomicrobiae bacterium]|nr:folylpolyglutamate synthase/dihydrofolate synthase family protein [Verrucomicrobiae bacterium]
MTDRPPTFSYEKAVQFLYQLQWFGSRFGLENTLKLATLSENPQERLRFIHVAGTNGKGSTCAMLESIYRAAGLRVGLFTSPHLISFRERIQVNRVPISETDVVRLVEELQAHFQEFSMEDHPTFFEAVTVMALRYFAEQDCDLVIWETGLGGRLDATNIVTPIASVITNVQLDHQKWLGETLPLIASEKAGIIKPGVPVITSADEPDAFAVLQKTALEKHAQLVRVESNHDLVESKLDSALPLPGEHQLRNAALALAVVKVLQKTIPISEREIRHGLASVQWPGRMQLHTTASGQRFVLDGAHNAAGAEALAATVKSYFPDAGRTLILGILQDKDWPAICRILVPLAQRVFLVPVQNQRTTAPEQLLATCRAANPTAEIFSQPSLANALSEAASDPLVIISGSLYLVGEALERLGATAMSACNERGLNEWNPGQTR